LVSADGTILYKKVGPFDARSIERDLLPAITAAAGK
jgi:cytochrome c biogenesis protein CcmG/thiol:disulfide interchange protein DsbE